MVLVNIPYPVKIGISFLIILFAFVLKGMYGAWNNTDREDWILIAFILWVLVTVMWGWFAYYSGKV